MLGTAGVAGASGGAGAISRPPHQKMQLQQAGVHLVDAAAERREGDGAHEAASSATRGSFSCPQAAPMSSPLLHLTVAVIPAFSSTDWKARMVDNGERPKVDPSHALNGIRLTL